MLLNFKFENFRSFKEDTFFTMIPSNKRTHGEYLIKDGKCKALPVAVIYGANASGKSNIVLAMDLLKNIVISGTINEKKSNGLVKDLAIMPFIHDKSYFKPMTFEIVFYQNECIFKYGITISSNDFQHQVNSITKEYLYIDENEVFTRNDNNVSVNFKKLIKMGYIKENSESYYSNLLESINQNLEREQLFLAGGFKNIINIEIYENIQNWFNKFIVLLNPNETKLLGGEFHKRDNDELFYENKVIEHIFNYAEFGNQKVKFIKDNDKELPIMVSIYDLPITNNDVKGNIVPKGLIVSSEAMESKGTIQLLNLVYPFFEILKNGGTIVLDEMDASLHFEIVVSIIRMFNNQNINKNGAQIIFNTHNPIYLDGELLRHDQIVMVKKDKKSLESELYSLLDFDLRPEEKILRNYLNGKYGALPHMDLELAFKHLLDIDKEVD